MENFENFFKCSFFKQTQFKECDSFIVQQDEIRLQDQSTTSLFKKINVEYQCIWIKQENWDILKPTILICIKNNLDLLQATIKNLQINNIHKKCNIIITDDRSDEDIKSCVLKNNLSYLRIDNSKGFNYSMLSNIPAFITHKLGCEEIILWNSDLWCVKEQYFELLLNKHRQHKGVISGTKLIYPPTDISFNKQETNKEFKQQKVWRETVQFGGSSWIPAQFINFSPMHAFRFKNKDDVRVNCDKGETFVTGALQLIDLQWFIRTGGLNPSLSKNFQDVDLCLRAIEENQKVFYFGKDIFFYHDESLIINKDKKIDLQFISDNILFGKIWNSKLQELVL